MRIRFDRKSYLQTGVIAALLLFPVSAFAANSDTDAQIQRLENEIQTLSRAVFKGEQPLPSIRSGNDSTQADIQNRLSQMEMNIQALTGKIEEQGNAINILKDQMANNNAGVTSMSRSGLASMPLPQPTPVPQPDSSAVMGGASSTYTYSSRSAGDPETQSDSDFTVADPDAPAPANAPTAGTLGTMTSSVDQNGDAIAQPGTPMAEYEAAFTMLRNQDYAAAQIAFDNFIKKNPGNTLIGNAMYWLGETYYVRGQFEPATKIFAEAYQKYPKGAKAPDNLLKLGLSLAGQGKTKDACVALGQLKKQYPAGSAPVLTRADQEIARLKCAAPPAQ